MRYFTSRIRSRPRNEDSRARQGRYLEALETLRGERWHYGHYLAKTRRCPRCDATWETFEEKMTDVNIAVELLGGAQGYAFDTAILVSGDSDLTRPVQAVQAGIRAIASSWRSRPIVSLRSCARPLPQDS